MTAAKGADVMNEPSIRSLGLVPLAMLLGACVSGAPSAGPEHSAKSGETVYQQVCMACHESGVAGAPKHGDRKAWEELIAEGQDVLSAHAWVGVRAMPPRGGDRDLTLAEFSRAVAYMARAAGGDWKDPDGAMLGRIRAEEAKRLEEMEKKSAQPLPHAEKSGEAVYRDVCRACHEAGVAGAPKYGDRKAWEELIEEGQDVLTAHAWVGVRAMPPRGGNPDLTLSEFARATAYMARAAGGDWTDPDGRMLERIRKEADERRRDMENKK